MLPVPIGLTSTYCEASPKSIGAAEALDEDDTEVALDEGWGSLLELGWGWLSSGFFWCLIGSLWLAGSCFFISSTLSTLNHLEADHETLTNHWQNYFILKYFHRSGDDFWCFKIISHKYKLKLFLVTSAQVECQFVTECERRESRWWSGMCGSDPGYPWLLLPALV